MGAIVPTILAPQSTAPSRLRRTQRRVLAALPSLVWFGALAGIGVMHADVDGVVHVTGFGDAAPVMLASPEPGCVRAVHVRLFESVRAGQMLISLDDAEERILLAQVEKDVERLRAEIAATVLRTRFDAARSAIEEYDVTRQFATDRESTRIDYLSQLVLDAKDRVQARWLTSEAEIVRDLLGSGHASTRELTEIEAALESLRVAIEQNAAVLARKQAAFEESDRRWGEYLMHEPVETELDTIIAPIRLAADVRQRDVEGLVRRIDLHVLRAPVDGEVSLLAVSGGDAVVTGTPLVVITPPRTQRLVAYLPETNLHAIQPGTSVNVRLLAPAPGTASELRGVVSAIAGAVTEAPARHRTYPTAPLYGRGFIVMLQGGKTVCTGERAEIMLGKSRLPWR